MIIISNLMQVELQKLQRLKQQSDSTITKLNTEIQVMRSRKTSQTISNVLFYLVFSYIRLYSARI